MTEDSGPPSRGVLNSVAVAAFTVLVMIVFLRKSLPLWMLLALIAAFLAAFVFQSWRRRRTTP